MPFIRSPKLFRSCELRQKLERRKLDRTAKRLGLEYWRRFSVALTPLLFVFVGIGFGTVARERCAREQHS